MKCKIVRVNAQYRRTYKAVSLQARVSKRVLVILVLSLLCVSCEQMGSLRGNRAKKTVREVQGLNGPIRSVSVAVAVPIDKNGTWKPGEQKLASAEAYDKQGNRTEHVIYTSDGTIGSKIVFTYDGQGNEVEAIWYDASGTPESRTVSTYDAEGRRTEVRSYAADGTLARRTVFTYDARGSETAAHSYTLAGVLESSTVSTYDSKGNLEETAWYYASGIQGGQMAYKRDAKGTLLSSAAFDYAADATLQSRTEVTYDARANPTEVVWYGDNGQFKKRETSTYKYDIFGNWTQRTTTKWVARESRSFFEPPVVSYRTLIYYGKGVD